jgi:hypothetical protein
VCTPSVFPESPRGFAFSESTGLLRLKPTRVESYRGRSLRRGLPRRRGCTGAPDCTLLAACGEVTGIPHSHENGAGAPEASCPGETHGESSWGTHISSLHKFEVFGGRKFRKRETTQRTATGFREQPMNECNP